MHAPELCPASVRQVQAEDVGPAEPAQLLPAALSSVLPLGADAGLLGSAGSGLQIGAVVGKGSAGDQPAGCAKGQNCTPARHMPKA